MLVVIARYVLFSKLVGSFKLASYRLLVSETFVVELSVIESSVE